MLTIITNSNEIKKCRKALINLLNKKSFKGSHEPFRDREKEIKQMATASQ